MLESREITGKFYEVSENPSELFPQEPYKAEALKCALEMMNDCVDFIYEQVHLSNPKTFKPKIYFSMSDEINAVSMQREIIVHAGLVFSVIKLIDEKYTDEVLDKYEIVKSLSKKEIRAGLRVYTWRFIVLHELIHIWHSHLAWLNKYKINAAGNIETKIAEDKGNNDKQEIGEKVNINVLNIASEEVRQLLLTYQAIELDADTCALSMLINMLMKDTCTRKERGYITNEDEYITAEIGLIMGAMATIFSLFDGNAGAKFELLKSDLDNMDHPIPAIRMYVAEEVADGMLWKYYPDKEKHFAIEKAWQHIVCDIEPYYEGEVDMGRVFYYTAYTEKAQRHLEKLRFHFNTMRETLEKLTLYILAEKMEDEDIKFDSQMVWFTDTGVSTRGWINPATGENAAIKKE